MNRLIHNKKATPLFVAAIVLACFALLPQARAVCKNDCLAGENTVHGDDALSSLTTGEGNTAIGYQALLNNTEGGGNTAVGDSALSSNTTGEENTANGLAALGYNTTGDRNTANGVEALLGNTIGFENTATGYSALSENTEGGYNTANGGFALSSNTTGEGNTANGVSALCSNTTGSSNIALGTSAGENLTTGNNNIDIGNEGVAGESTTIRIGTQGTQTATFIAGVSGTKVMGQAVKVNAAGQIGTAPSSARFKDQIKPMDKASEAILALEPVTFRYKKEIDPDGTPQFGLVAEQVEKVSPDLIVRDRDGKPYSVRYEAVNAMLLNEFLKEHNKVDAQQTTIGQLKSNAAKQEITIRELRKDLGVLKAQLKEQATQIQKVSAQIAFRRVAPRMVSDN
jgi:hypothetical protein